MTAKSMDLVWIVVKDFKEALKYYTEVLGLKLLSQSEEYNWAELRGPNGGSILGICSECDQSPIKAGQNAVVTFSVADIEKTKAELVSKGVKLIGETQTVPGHVIMQLIQDESGNLIHLCQNIEAKCGSCCC